MTFQDNFTLRTEYLEQLSEQGSAYLPELIRILVNAAMQIERQKHLGAGRHERNPERRGHANGYKPKTVQTRIGGITFDIPQVREGDFYPDALEKGLRSERALTLALAEMYVQGVSTRKVKAVRPQRFRTQSNGGFSAFWLDYTPILCRCCWRRNARVSSLSLYRFLMTSLSLPK